MHDNEASTRAAAPDTDALASAMCAVLEADGTAIAVLDLDGTPRAVNRSALHLLGAASLDDIRPGTPGHEALQALLDHTPRHLANGTSEGTWHGDIDVTSASGERLVFRATVTVLHGRAPAEPGFIGIAAQDVTGARDEATRLRHRADHDGLTGLANRRQILTALERVVARQRDRPGQVAAIFIDLDRLKYVNDALGHQIGDRLLVAAAHRLAGAVRPDDHVARIGGDEFLVVCADIGDEAAALEVAERIRRALTGRLRLDHLDLHFSVSIGVALSEPELSGSNDAAVAATLVSDADTAMYEAKTGGRGRCVMFTPAMRTATRERTALGAALSQAIDDRRLSIAYQPVFSAVDGRLVGAEALVRWRHHERGLVEPSEFVAIAEQSGTIGKMGQFVMEEAMAQARRWREHGVVDEDFAVHVNVSPMQLASSTFVSDIVGLLQQHDVQPQQLVLEAREAALLGRSADVDRSVRALRRLGVRIAVDNFGTGTNALSVLTDVGADILKLDGSYGLSGGTTETDARLVRAVVILAHALDMRVVAERIDDVDQLRRLRSAGCDHVQGNLLGPAADPDELVTVAAY